MYAIDIEEKNHFQEKKEMQEIIVDSEIIN